MRLFKNLIGAAGGALIAGQALAGGWDPNGVTVADAQDLNISGATASEYAIRDYIIGTLCDAGGADIRMFTVNGLYDFNSNRFAIACSVAGIPGADKNMIVRKEGSGGSYKGVAPVCDNTELRAYVDPTVAGCQTVTTANVAAPNGRIVDVYTCSATVNLEAEGGISDLGPTEGLQDTSANCDNVRPAFITPFGIAVTKKLRDALQLAQNIRPCGAEHTGTRCEGTSTPGGPVDAGWAARDDDGDGNSNEEDAENQPSISNALLTSLTTAAVPRWSDVVVLDPNNEGALTALDEIVGLNDWGLDPDTAANYTTSPVDDRVTLCFRATTSGTRAENAVVMNRQKCTSGARNLAARSAFDAAGPTVMPLNSGTGDETKCLTNMNIGRNYNIGISGGEADTGSIWAVGHVSLDRVPVGPDKNDAAGTDDGYRLIKLDGRLGTFENIANGSYYHYGESTIQWENDLNANESFIMNQIDNGASAPALLGALRRAHSWGTTGVMGLTCPFTVTNGTTGVTSYDVTRPASPLTRGGNNCTVAVMRATCDYSLETNANAGSPAGAPSIDVP